MDPKETIADLAFQSTAHPKAGRNPSEIEATSAEFLFQSTAHPKAGRNGGEMYNPLTQGLVSIHGPPEGRPKRCS